MGSGKDNIPDRVLVIDDDEMIANQITGWFKNKGSRNVTPLSIPEKAWAESLSKKYQMIILDWNLGGELNGVGLFNRWKNHEYYQDIPVYVISGYLSDLNFSILEEFPMTAKISKPVEQAAFFKTVTDLHSQSEWYRQQKQNISTVLKGLNSSDFMKQITGLIDCSPAPYYICCATGNLLFANDQLDEAEIMFQRAVMEKKDSILALNALGKIALARGDNKSAKKYLTAAMSKSPDNIERLCNLGDICLQDMEIEKANQLFSKALALDDAHSRSKSGKSHSKNIAVWLDQIQDIPTSYASMLNSMAISMARSGQFQECIDHYKQALKIVGDDKLKSKLSFNLGLGYARWKKHALAKEWFQKSVDYDPAFKKAGVYLEKTSAMDFNEPLFEEFESSPDIALDVSELMQPEISSSKKITKEDELDYSMVTEDPFSDDLSDDSLGDDDLSGFNPDDPGAKTEFPAMNMAPFLKHQSTNNSVASTLYRATKRTLEIFSLNFLDDEEKYQLMTESKSCQLHIRSQKAIRYQDKDQYFVRMVCTDPGFNVANFVRKSLMTDESKGEDFLLSI